MSMGTDVLKNAGVNAHHPRGLYSSPNTLTALLTGLPRKRIQHALQPTHAHHRTQEGAR